MDAGVSLIGIGVVVVLFIIGVRAYNHRTDVMGQNAGLDQLDDQIIRADKELK